MPHKQARECTDDRNSHTVGLVRMDFLYATRR